MELFIETLTTLIFLTPVMFFINFIFKVNALVMMMDCIHNESELAKIYKGKMKDAFNSKFKESLHAFNFFIFSVILNIIIP